MCVERREARGNPGRRHALGFLAAIALISLPASRILADVECPSRYDLGTPGVVVDRDTHLTWQRDIDTTGGVPCITGEQGCYAYPDAKTYCQGLTVAGGGFRLPTVNELSTLIDEAKVATSASPVGIDEIAFPGTPPGYFWSSNAVPGDPQSIYAVLAVTGNPASGDVGGLTAFHVRCVR